ncbi:MAG: hypothetical protein E6H08_05990 [Bacteroidetes bacterium]|nr:MAG: hypothetical protein E6H08_05990 [Bacteroidota bacterium]
MAKHKKAVRKTKKASVPSRLAVLEAKVGLLQSGDVSMHNLLLALNQSNINSWAVLRQLKADFDQYVRLNPGVPSPIPPQG